jgi:uncharacterized protein (UPF0264 family)
MRLLVSVRSAGEAAAAVTGGADIVDAKDPAAGALGAVAAATFRQIAAAAGGGAILSAALGDASTVDAIARDARTFADAGAALVKVGFAGVGDAARVRRLLEAAVDGARGAHVVAVAYADWDAVDSIAPSPLIAIAAGAGARGLLIDTALKSRPGLRALMTHHALAAWVQAAHDAHLFAAVAGKLEIDDLVALRGIGADVAGVRGAACTGGRIGTINADKVRRLRQGMSHATELPHSREAAYAVSAPAGNARDHFVATSELRRRQEDVRRV